MNTEQEQLTLEYTLSSECSCSYYDEDTDTEVESSECFGCFDDDVSNIQLDYLNKWLSANHLERSDVLKIQGTNLGWQHLSGYKLTVADDLIHDLCLNAQFTLYFYANADHTEIQVVRSSHDELGASFTVVKATEDEEYEYRCNQ